MRSGALRHRVTIEELTNTQDSFGGEVGAWSAFASNIPASFEPVSGKELIAADVETSQITARFRIRHLSGVTAAMRVVYDGRIFQIVSPPIDPRGLKKELHLMTVETM
jgi:SPP1 family predicted phage head-tail adaptor